ncbi:MAG TPA: hypothetical protein VFE05_17825 [Longimicrobiaceae bacterium]|nr:hypothetical protein [Longimicrobiaceae bacterium]
MDDKIQNDGLDEVQVEPLSDAAHEEVAGGVLADSSSGTCCSCSSCSSAAPTKDPAPLEPIYA